MDSSMNEHESRKCWCGVHAYRLIIIGALCFLLSGLVAGTNAATIGIGYGTSGDNLPPTEQVVQFLKTLNVTKVKIYNTDANVIRAFANSGMDLSITVPNGDIIHMATDMTFTQNWVIYNLQPFVPATTITTIAVGNEILTSDTADTDNLVPAMVNLHSALVTAGLGDIKVSTPHAFSVLNVSFPPSASVFRPSFAASVMKPLLDFLNQTGSPFMVNIFPFFSYMFNYNTINLDYALLNPNAPPVNDPGNGKIYTNLWDAQIDAIISAMASLGHPSIPIVVTESGWPSVGDVTQVGPSVANAQTYNNNLVKLVLADPPKGTPLRPGVATPTYIFSLFNENLKTGKITEKNWGLFHPDMSPVYTASLST